MLGLNAAAFFHAAVGVAALHEGIVSAAEARVRGRADEVLARFVAATLVRTGATAADWHIEDTQGGAAVVNARQAANSFVVASGLITGTGSRGVSTTGYGGSFASGWAGMAPASDLHAAWEDETHKDFAAGALLGG